MPQQNAYKTFTISTARCDFSSSAVITSGSQMTISTSFSVDTMARGQPIILNSGTTYYLNIKNEDSAFPGVESCTNASGCGFVFNIYY